MEKEQGINKKKVEIFKNFETFYEKFLDILDSVMGKTIIIINSFAAKFPRCDKLF